MSDAAYARISRRGLPVPTASAIVWAEQQHAVCLFEKGSALLIIRLGLFDDHDIVRAGFKHILGQHSDIVIQAQGRTGREALDALTAHDDAPSLDVCLIDLALPDMSGLDVLAQAREMGCRTAVLVLSSHPEEHYGLAVLKAGASGYLSKTLAADQLVAAVRTVAAGRRYVSPLLAEKLAGALDVPADRPPHARLSTREFQIFSKLVRGSTVSAIALDLQLSAKTVSTYRARLLDKLGFNSNAELTQYAMRHKLLS